jgi:hypothetical protein
MDERTKQMNTREMLRAVIRKFGWVADYVTEEFYSVGSSLQEEVAEAITGMVERTIRPTLANYIAVYGQEGFDRMVREDRDVFEMIEKYRPSYLRYFKQGRKFRDYIRWDSARLSRDLELFVTEKGITVSPAASRYLFRVCEEFRRRLYESTD